MLEQLLDDQNYDILTKSTNRKDDVSISGATVDTDTGNDTINDNDNDNDNNNTKMKKTVSYYRAGLNLILGIPDDYNILTTTTASSTSTTRNNNNNSNNNDINMKIQYAAEIIYSLVHARYVTSPRGLDTIMRMMMMPTATKTTTTLATNNIQVNTNNNNNNNNNNNKKKKKKRPIFGTCTRIGCNHMALLPIGEYDDFNGGGTTSTTSSKNSINNHNREYHPTRRYCCSCGEVRLFF